MSSSDHHIKYRPDIDGLRAIAVTSVLVFHAFPKILPGGFVGVDIFFVISGFLITGILLSDLRAKTYSLAGFYARRIRRIYPALVTVLAVTFGLGWLILLPVEFAQLGKHILSSAAFCVNLVLWNESGYFDNAAETKPLLHLWSLGVEEQFYIVWPVILWLLTRKGRSVAVSIAVIGLASFALNIFQTAQNPTAAFYSPLPRFWELLTGAALAVAYQGTATRRPFLPGRLNDHPWMREAVSLAGLGLIAVAIFGIREKGFPGWQALLPVGGAALLIAGGKSAFLNGKVLSLRPFVYIGKISYPLYLWHWPLLSFARIYYQAPPSPGLAAILIALSVVLAAVTYTVVERPFRGKAPSFGMSASLLGAMTVLALTGLMTMRLDGFSQRSAALRNYDLRKGFDGGYPSSADECSFLTSEQKHLFTCIIDRREEPRFAAIGDSKAGAVFQGLMRTSVPGSRWIYFGSGDAGRLVPVISDQPIYSYVNKESVRTALDYLIASPTIDTVVLATASRALFALDNDYTIEDLPSSPNYTIARDALDSTVVELVNAGKRVILVIDNPTLPHIEDCLNRQTGSDLLNRILGQRQNLACHLTLERQLTLSRQYRDMIWAVANRHPGQVDVFDTVKILCDVETDLCPMFQGDRPLYGVADHISDYAATIVGSAVNARLEPRRGPPPTLQDLVVDDWGAKQTRRGEGINVQPNGHSALWIRLKSPSKYHEFVIRFGQLEKPKTAYVNGNSITSAVPQSVIDTVGEYPIVLENDLGQRVEVGTLSVLP